MNSIGEFVLIIGDIHIPQRAASLPEQFRDLLMPGKMQHVICPGNVGSREVSIPISLNNAVACVVRRVAGELGCGEEPGAYREG